jgi:hypothetical protein
VIANACDAAPNDDTGRVMSAGSTMVRLLLMGEFEVRLVDAVRLRVWGASVGVASRE